MKNKNSAQKVSLKSKGWMWFGGVMSLQILFIVLSYVLKTS